MRKAGDDEPRVRLVYISYDLTGSPTTSALEVVAIVGSGDEHEVGCRHMAIESL